MNAALQQNTIPAIGKPMHGGFFAGIIQLDGQQFGIVVAPKSTEISGEWGNYGKRIDGADHIGDGLANTRAMATAGSSIATKALAIAVDPDNSDQGEWYIPARDELDLLYRNLKPTTDKNYCWFRDGENLCSVPLGYKYTEDAPAQTQLSAFQHGGAEALAPTWHWSSTQSSANYAFVQDFSDGSQYHDLKDTDWRVRAVRRFLIN